MKSILILLFGSTLLLQGQEKPNPAAIAETAYAKGIAAEKEGDPAAAQAAYVEALKINPKHANARYRLGQVKIHAKEIAAKGRENALGGVTIPEIQFEDASLEEALEALGAAIEKQSDEEILPGFIVQDPAGKLSAGRVTLHLKNIPAKAALDYVISQVGAKVRYDEHATVIVPLGS